MSHTIPSLPALLIPFHNHYTNVQSVRDHEYIAKNAVYTNIEDLLMRMLLSAS